MTADQLRVNHPEVAEVLLAEGRAEGAAAERERQRGLQAAAMPGFEALLAAAKADGRTTGPELALRIVAAMRSNLAASADALIRRAAGGPSREARA
jgi:hypothetical protein